MSLMPDHGGLIDQVALCVPADFLRASPGAEWFQPLVPLGNLLKSLPAESEAILLIDKVCQIEAERWIGTLSPVCRVRFAPGADHHTALRSPWIQDAFHIGVRSVQDLRPAAILTLDGKDEGGRLADFLGIPATAALTDLPGGNQLVGPGFRLIGQHSLASDPNRSSPANSALQQLDDSRRISVFGARPAADPPGGGNCPDAKERLHQFGFHVDQFVSVTGLMCRNRPLLMVAEPYPVAGSTSPFVAEARKRLDGSVAVLRCQGFEVVRNPVPWVITPDSGKRLPRLYNNLLLENEIRSGRSKPLIWLPQFSDAEPLETFDRLNRQVWEGLGFEVIPVFGWSYFASRNGAVRCATKTLRRRTSSSSMPN